MSIWDFGVPVVKEEAHRTPGARQKRVGTRGEVVAFGVLELHDGFGAFIFHF